MKFLVKIGSFFAAIGAAIWAFILLSKKQPQKIGGSVESEALLTKEEKDEIKKSDSGLDALDDLPDS